MKYILLLLTILTLSAGCQNRPESKIANKDDDDFSILVAGDAVISLEWSQFNEPEFLGLIEQIRDADVSIVNLEMLIHDYEGYPQAVSGGTYMRAPPEIANELAWAGFDLVSNANNHSFDYGSIGVLRTIENVEKAGIEIAGVGEDLQQARSPAYFDSRGKRVALISMTTSFPFFGAAGRSSKELHGRPGLNPLTIKEPGQEMDFFDLEENMSSIRQASMKADLVVISVHTHQKPTRISEPPEFLIDLAHTSIDAGADVFFSHGSHFIKGVEIYNGKPIFYGLGNFVFQNESITKQPSEFYNKYGLSDSASVDEVYDIRTTGEDGVDTRGFTANEIYWRSVVPVISFEGNNPSRINLIPIDLLQEKPRGQRGRPILADPILGKEIIDRIIDLSARYGTKIEHDPINNTAKIIIDPMN